MMTKNKLITYFLISLITPLSYGAGDVIPGKGLTESQNEDVDKMKQLLSIPEVQKIYSECEKNKAPKMDECVWNGVSNAGLQDQVNQLFNKQTDSGKDKSFEAVSLGKQSAKKQSKGLEALQSYYSQRLNSVLYGEEYKDGRLVKGQTQYVDHTKFNELYRSQIGKNIITSLSSYCIEADSSISFLIFDDKFKRNQTRDGNEKKLSVLTAKNTIEAASDWEQCIANVQHICHYDDSKQNNTIGINLEDMCDNGSSKKNSTTQELCTPDDIEYSKKRACEVVQYLKVAKQNLLSLDKIDQQYAELNKGGAGTQLVNVKMNSMKKEGETTDDLVSITSNELKNKAGYEQAMKEEQEKFKECMDENGQIANSKACENYLNTDRENANRALAEAKLRTESIDAKIQALKQDGTEEDVKSYLAEQGYTEEEIEAKFDLSSVDLKNEIADRYEQEKQQLIASMRDRIEEKTSKNEGAVSATSDPNANDGDEDKLKQIQDELASNTKNYAQLIRYNNIVSGYLEIKTSGDDKDKEEKRNTASVFRELKDQSDDNAAMNQAIQQAVSQTGLEESSGSDNASTKNVGTSDINKLLKMQAEKSDKQGQNP